VVGVPEQFTTIDDYITTFPDEVQVILNEIRRRMHHAAPGAEETIRYRMPTIQLDGQSLVHFAAWKKHIALYPKPTGDEAFERDLAPYATEKATLQFPLSQSIPYDLIERVTALLVEQRIR
jgi:uncharacterized protein YdhG (YjbR/CyaY superfamily)